MATAVVTMAPFPTRPARNPPPPHLDPGPSSSASPSSSSPGAPRPPAKSFKRMLRTSLQETVRQVSNAGRKSEKGKEPEPKKAAGRSAQAPPPSAFMEYISRPSLFRRSNESERTVDTSASSPPVSPANEDGRKSATPSMSSTITTTSTTTTAERRPRVLRKHSRPLRSETPQPQTTTTTVTVRPSASKPASPPKEQRPAIGDLSSADNKDKSDFPGWGAFIPPTLSKGSMSSPALHALKDDDPTPDHHPQQQQTKSPSRHRSALSSLGAFIALPQRVRKPSLVLPPKSTVTPTPVPAAQSRSHFHFEIPTRSSKSKVREPVAPVTISRPKPMQPISSVGVNTSAAAASSPSAATAAAAVNASSSAVPIVPARSPSRSQPMSITTTVQNGTANGHGNASPSPSSPKGSRFMIGMGHPSTSSRRLPGASASTSHLPIASSTPSASASTSNLLANGEGDAPSGSAIRNPAAPTAASMAKKTSLELKRKPPPAAAEKRSSLEPKRTSIENHNNDSTTTASGLSRRAERRTTPTLEPAAAPRRASIDAQTKRPSIDSTRPVSPRRTSIDARRPGSTDGRKPSVDSRRPSLDQGALTPRATTPMVARELSPSPPSSSSTPRARSPTVTARRATPSPVPAPTRPTRLGRGIGSASTSHLPLSSSPASSSPLPTPLPRSSTPTSPVGPRLMPRRSSHGHTTSVPVALSSASASGDNRSASPATSTTSSSVAPSTTTRGSSGNGFAPGHRTKAASLDLLSLPPERDLVRRAGTVLVRELVHRRSSLTVNGNNREAARKMHEELDKRMNALANMNGKVAAGTRGEERELKRYFAEAVKDGYTLCHYIDKLHPGCILRIDAQSRSNVSKFIGAAAKYGVPNEEICTEEDFTSLEMTHLASISSTILAIARIADNPPPRKFVPGSSSGSIYASSGSSISTPNLLRASSPSALSRIQRRLSPPVPLLPTVRSASPTNDPKDESALADDDEEEDVFGPITTLTPGATRSSAGQRTSTTSRTSMASSDATTAYSSLLDPRTSTRFGTIRTMTTEATDVPSLTPTEASSAKAALLMGEYEPSPSAKRQYSSIPSSPVEGDSPRRRFPDRRISDDLARVAEETDEGGTVPRNSIKPAEHVVNLRKGKWPDDFIEAFKFPPASSTSASSPVAAPTTFIPPRTSSSSPSPPPSSTVTATRTPTRSGRKPTPIKIPPSDGGGTEEISLDSPVLPTTPLPVHNGAAENGTPRVSSPPRMRARRTSELDKDELTPQPLTPTSPKRIRRRSTRTSSDFLLPKDAVAGSREISPARNSGEIVARRRVSSKNYGSRAKSEDSLRKELPVPFPRRASAELSTAVQHSPSPETVEEDEAKPSSSKLEPAGAGTRLEKDRRSSFGDQQLRASILANRPRHESMMNIGSGSSPKGDGLIAGMDGSAVRRSLIVKEEGKPSVHYQLGNCIGRGQFGSVYRALNLNTGQTVAVKRIRLEGLSEKEIEQLMHEVEIVKRLSHPSIVKYEGMARDSDTLSIVLEYAENGSLAQTLKAFGRLNESLVASYVTKVLEGLHYLHSSEVVHCDLKAANILTTKTGNVKLSDFGVSLNLRAMEQIKNDVAGTPNWMAPEVIELKGASPASDIWSLACTIIELLTGAPPYADVQNSMTVMFRIVEDDMPAIPDGLTEPLQDFLKRCFNKDPSQRPDAVQLFEHPWLKNEWGLFKELRPQDSIPFLRRVSAEVQRSDVRHLQFVDEERPSSPRSIVSVTAAAESTPRPHDFVKSHFSQDVTCRVCNQPGRKSIMFCKQCNLIAHAKCVPDTSEECEDLQTRVLRLSLDFQRDALFRQGSPPPLARQQSPSPISRQTSPIPGVRQAATSPLSATPINAAPYTPPVPVVTQSERSERFRIFKKKSKASSLVAAPSNESLGSQATSFTPASPNSPPVAYENVRPTRRLPRPKSSEDENFLTAKSRHSRHSASTRSAQSVSEEVQEGHDNQRGSKVDSDLSRGSRISTVSMSEEVMVAADAAEEAYRKRRGTRRESRDRDSDGSRCVVQ